MYPEEFCHAYRRPESSRPCIDATACEFAWFASQWSSVWPYQSHSPTNQIKLTCLYFTYDSARPAAAAEFRPVESFVAKRKMTLSPKLTTANAIQTRDTITPPNATCRLISARVNGSLVTGVRYVGHLLKKILSSFTFLTCFYSVRESVRNRADPEVELELYCVWPIIQRLI